jgi:hypothetical protein
VHHEASGIASSAIVAVCHAASVLTNTPLRASARSSALIAPNDLQPSQRWRLVRWRRYPVQIRETGFALRVVLVPWSFARAGPPGAVECDPIQNLGEHGLSAELLGKAGQPVLAPTVGYWGQPTRTTTTGNRTAAPRHA